MYVEPINVKTKIIIFYFILQHIADVPVIVRIPPVISDNSTRSVITTVGSKVTLQCYGSGWIVFVSIWSIKLSESLCRLSKANNQLAKRET